MRASTFTIGLVLTLAACANPVVDARRELEIAEKAGRSASELCQLHRRVVEAILRDGNEADATFEKTLADSRCLRAQMGITDVLVQP